MFGKEDKYPKKVRVAIGEILETAILSIRFNLREGNLEYCQIELDHIHNLPMILKKYELGELKYYWDITREDYIEKLKKLEKSDLTVYKIQWEVLKRYCLWDFAQLKGVNNG